MSENYFLKYLTEAPEDDANNPPPDVPEDNPPPDLNDTGADDAPMDEPPDLDENFGEEEGGFDEDENNQQPQEDEKPEINVDNLSGKVSAILNEQLYQRFLSMLTTLGNQISLLKNNNDVLRVVTKDIGEISTSYTKLDENIRMYLTNIFINENYSKNLLFYNKCLNLMALLNESFDKKVSKGIRDAD